MQRLVVGALAVAMGAVFAAPALAVNQTVAVEASDTFSPARVAIKAGDTVTWNNPGGFESHNVRFEDNQFTMPSTPASSFNVTRSTFTANGTYRYYCEVHGGPGGVGMSGVVYVNASGTLPPAAQFVVSPDPATAGQAVTFDATTSTPTNPGRPITKYEWDLDGDGMFELNTGTTPTTTKTYMTAQTVKAKLQVTDSENATDERTRTVTIDPVTVPTPQPEPTPTPQPGPSPPPQPAPQPAPQPIVAPAPAVQLQPQPTPRPATVRRRPAGKCSKLKGKRRSACIKRSCAKLKGAKRRACVKKVTRKASTITVRAPSTP